MAIVEESDLTGALIARLSVCPRAGALLFGVLLAISILYAQAVPEAPARFEVASIRPVGGSGGRPSIEFTPGGGVRATNVTVKTLIQAAYDIRPEQLPGGPGWTGSEEYTIIAKGPAGDPFLAEAAQQELTRRRLQVLLTERFQLALEREASPTDGYVLTVGKKGHKMTLASGPETRRSLRQTGRWELHAEAVEVSGLARFLSVHLRARVEDRTALNGRYNFYLNWTPDPLPSSIASLDGLPEESLIPAVQEQLGLRLERQKVVTDRYTIRHIEKVTEN